ncbi:MAG: hypothetical protein LBO63_02665 [Oscillospiraceae bacterium]|jgi:hypothetical protein|nr:hypothetical protein [Oscillospiraceae bacterium]
MNTIEEIFDTLAALLAVNNVSFETWHGDGIIELFFDTERKLVCKIDLLSLYIAFFGVGLTLNLDEGDESDALNIAEAAGHITHFLTDTVYLERIYKKGKLCAEECYCFENSEKRACSAYCVRSILILLPFRKERKTSRYKYVAAQNDETGVFRQI